MTLEWYCERNLKDDTLEEVPHSPKIILEKSRSPYFGELITDSRGSTKS